MKTQQAKLRFTKPQPHFSNPKEFLLGNDLLVAPVLDEGEVTRDIYLPTGAWRDEANPEHPIYNGPIWIREYPADLWTLPYFTAVSDDSVGLKPAVSLLLAVMGLYFVL